MANVQVVFDQMLGTDIIKNVTYWQFPNFDSITLQTFADNQRARWLNRAVPSMSTSWVLESLTMRQMDGGGGFTQLVTFTTGPLAGSDAGQILPPQNALLVSTGFLGPKPNRGRVYFGGLTEAGNNALGQVEPNTLDEFVALVEGWRDGVVTGAGSCFLRIARPDFNNNTWTLNNPVESVIGRSIWATQRRRRPGVGV